MYPYIPTPWGNISTFTLMASLGVLVMIFTLFLSLRHAKDRDGEAAYIMPRIVLAGGIGMVFAGLADAGFKFVERGKWEFSGITFYGGLLGGMSALFVLLHFSQCATQYTNAEWFNKVTVPFILFHIFGRLGCFLGGCCYGKQATGPLAVLFSDHPEADIFHYGQTRYPTQLFEAVALIGILVIVLCVKNRFQVYLASYASVRFALEFLRDDDRGSILGNMFSPSQWISVCIMIGLVGHGLIKQYRTKYDKRAV